MRHGCGGDKADCRAGGYGATGTPATPCPDGPKDADPDERWDGRPSHGALGVTF
jgi:hypothetical protein